MGTLVKFKDLESRERIGTQLQVSERLANLGRITAGVAHEVKNPLNSMRIWLENLKASLPDVDGLPLQAVRVLDSEIDRLDSVVKRFLDFTRPPEMHQEESSLKEILEEVLAVERPELDKANIKLDARLAADVPYVLVDKPLLKQALINLLVNAVDAMTGGGQLFVSLAPAAEKWPKSKFGTRAAASPPSTGNASSSFSLRRGREEAGSDWRAPSEPCNCTMVRSNSSRKLGAARRFGSTCRWLARWSPRCPALGNQARPSRGVSDAENPTSRAALRGLRRDGGVREQAHRARGAAFGERAAAG